jgi:hypothetical protein
VKSPLLCLLPPSPSCALVHGELGLQEIEPKGRRDLQGKWGASCRQAGEVLSPEGRKNIFGQGWEKLWQSGSRGRRMQGFGVRRDEGRVSLVVDAQCKVQNLHLWAIKAMRQLRVPAKIMLTLKITKQALLESIPWNSNFAY